MSIHPSSLGINEIETECSWKWGISLDSNRKEESKAIYSFNSHIISTRLDKD